ncbi:hypothetical protein [Methylobacter sp.]|uniref:hypothetical protein n=1 Tax=Methylobacter sp. TaxID=2051955 RepID=UPI002FDE228B
MRRASQQRKGRINRPFLLPEVDLPGFKNLEGLLSVEKREKLTPFNLFSLKRIAQPGAGAMVFLDQKRQQQGLFVAIARVQVRLRVHQVADRFQTSCDVIDAVQGLDNRIHAGPP